MYTKVYSIYVVTVVCVGINTVYIPYTVPVVTLTYWKLRLMKNLPLHTYDDMAEISISTLRSGRFKWQALPHDHAILPYGERPFPSFDNEGGVV